MSSTERHWQTLDLARTRQFHDPEVSLSTELAAVRSEHAGLAQYDGACLEDGCGGTTQFRPTVGARTCPDCGALSTSSGRRIAGPR
jgi:hypothetical protein